MSRAGQFLAVAALLRERYEAAPALELPLLASVIAYLEALADQEAAEPAGAGSAAPAARGVPEAERGPEGGAPAPAAAGPWDRGVGPLPADEGEAAGEPVPLFGTFRETGWGGVVDRDDGEALRIPYSVMEAARLRHGDRVALTPKPDDADHYRCTRTGATLPLRPVRIRERVASLQGEEGRWEAVVGDRVVRVRRARQMTLRLGDVVSLRYEEGELSEPDGAAWALRVHDVPPVDAAGSAPEGTRRRTVRRRGTAETAARLRSVRRETADEQAPAVGGGDPPAGRETGAGTPGEEPGEPPGPGAPEASGHEGRARAPETPPDRPHLLVIGGHERARLQYRSALARVAAVEAVDGTRLTRSLRDRLTHAQAVVLVTQHMSHTVSNYVNAQLRASGVPSICARSQNRSGLVRQVTEELLPLLGEARAADAGPTPADVPLGAGPAAYAGHPPAGRTQGGLSR